MHPCPAGLIRMRTRSLALLLAALAVSGAARDAAAVEAPANASADDHRARALFQRAELSFNLGRFADALGDYQAAYQARPLPAFLFNIAQCYRNVASYERARFFYRRYLALDPRTSNRRLVEDLIGEMSRKLQKDDANEADGATAAPPAAARTAPAPPANVRLDPAPAPAPAPAAAASSTISPLLIANESAPAPATSSIYRRWWFWAGIGVAAAGVAVLGVLATRPETPQGSLGTINGR
jgi:tetratricopeptide (TPR) repeat protein